MRAFVGFLLAAAGLCACDARSDASDTVARDAADADDASQEGAVVDDASTAGDGDGDEGDDGGEATVPVYALKTVIDVTWGHDAQLPVYDPGAGAITLFHRLSTDSACEDGEIEALELVPCGIEFPEYTSILACAAYQLELAEGGALALDGETSVPLELGKLGVTYREAACGVGFGPESALVFRGLLATQTSTTDCDPTIDDASLGGCAQARSLTALIDAQLSLGSGLGLCEGTDAAMSGELGEGLDQREAVLGSLLFRFHTAHPFRFRTGSGLATVCDANVTGRRRRRDECPAAAKSPLAAVRSARSHRRR